MSSAKAALESDTRVLAFEAGRKFQIRVNTISAGPLGSRAAKAIGFIDDMIRCCSASASIVSSMQSVGPSRDEEIAALSHFQGPNSHLQQVTARVITSSKLLRRSAQQCPQRKIGMQITHARHCMSILLASVCSKFSL